MAVSRTINQFTFARDKRELEELLSSHKDVLGALQDAKELRDKIETIKRLQEQQETDYTDYLKHETKRLQEAKDILTICLSEYRDRCKFSKMSVKQAKEHLAKMEEFAFDYAY